MQNILKSSDNIDSTNITYNCYSSIDSNNSNYPIACVPHIGISVDKESHELGLYNLLDK